MSEENTERFEGSTPFEIRVLRELVNIGNRLTTLEEKVDSRLKETRPIWEAVLARLDGMETRLDGMETRLDSMGTRLDSMDTRLAKMDAKFDVVGSQLLDMRGDVEMLKKRPPAA